MEQTIKMIEAANILHDYVEEMKSELIAAHRDYTRLKVFAESLPKVQERLEARGLNTSLLIAAKGLLERVLDDFETFGVAPTEATMDEAYILVQASDNFLTQIEHDYPEAYDAYQTQHTIEDAASEGMVERAA